jgi:hypothetical protein
MASVDDFPTCDEVRRILVAAADVIFSDGVSEAFLDHWADETVFMLSLPAHRQVTPAPSAVAPADGSVPASRFENSIGP